MKADPPSHMAANKFAGALAATECGLGSLLHAFHVPLSGHFLSLNQAAIQTLSSKDLISRRELLHNATKISVIGSSLKALAPFGKKITPMIAIMVQGWLFGIGAFIFGANLAGVIAGSVLLSLWAFVQSAVLAYLLLGARFFEALAQTVESIPFGLSTLLVAIALKPVAAATIAALAWRKSALVHSYSLKVAAVGPRAVRESPRGLLRDLASPWLLLSLLMTVVFMAIAEKATYTQMAMYTLRVFGSAMLFYWLVRKIPREKFQQLLSRS